MENPYVDTGVIPEIYSDESAVALSRKIAEQSIVLLKNDDNLLC